nr:MAG TPA: hypothetical protein [Caudoviricetes sp.]
MENDNGKSYYGIGLDNSQLEQDAAKANQILHGIDEEAERQSAAVRDLLSNIPTINIDIVSNAPTTLESIDAAFAEIDRVVGENELAIKELEKEYERLDKAAGAAFMKGDDKTAKALQEQERAIRKVINARKQVNKEAAATADELLKEDQRLKEEAAAAEQAAEKHISLRQRLREIKTELVEMEAAGQRGTAAYQALQEEAGRLADAWGDAQAQATILANDQRGLQGIISGLNGISGAAAIAQGAVGLFGGENEKLQQIMLRVQSVMAITMGLQQVQQTLNKDSAFSLVTLNSLKKIWNKLIGDGATAMEAENTATEVNTAAQQANTVATTADTAAQQTNNTSTVAGTTAQIANTTATRTATVATVAQTVATKAASLALKGLKIALVTTGIGALIVLVGELAGWLMKLFDSTSKADEEFKEQEEVLSKGREAYAKSSLEIENYKNHIEHFNGTKAQEKQLVKELNNKYGEAMGYYNNLSQWKKVLVEKGEAYCNMLLKEAEAQAILTKYTEAFITLQEVKDKAARGDFDHWYNTRQVDEYNRKQEIGKAEETMNKWLTTYKQKMNEAQQIRDNFDLNPHVDPSTLKKGKDFDPQKAALEIKKAIEEYRKTASKYIKDANDELNNLVIDAQEQGLVRELNEIRRGTRQKLQAWNEQLDKLAEARKEAAKARYMNQKGATEVGWANSVDGKKSIMDWIAVIKKESPNIIAEYDRVWAQILANGQKAIESTQQRYTDALIDEFGTDAQKEEKLLRVWTQKIATLPDEFKGEALKQMEEAFSKLGSEKFKKAINWEGVFGDLSKQALPVLEFTLGKIKQYFEQNKDAMSTQEIKDYQEAIKNMEDEIANRNPFAALHKSIKDISAAKTELIEAYAAMQQAEDNLSAAIKERNAAQEAYNEIIAKVENGEIVDGCNEQTEAYDRLNKAKENARKATEDANNAEQRYMRAQNQTTNAYKRFASNLKNVGSVINGVGSKAKNLASIFSEDVANGIGKALDFMDEIMDATSDVINAIGDVGKSVAGGIETAVQASATGATAAAATGATAISTIEKASVILAVISAALQVATAIANLFNNDDSKQKEIENLQERIDQLQWELDNKEAVRLRDTYGDAVERLRRIYAETTLEIIKMHMSSESYGNAMSHWLTTLRYKADIYEKTVEKIADAYAAVSYTADKALGSKRYEESRKQLENLAGQQVLIQQQIDKENSKKKTNHGKVQDYQNKITEVAEKMATVINEMLENIIGSSAEDLASELGNAFFEAAKQGENAMESWHQKVNDIVGDIIKRMLVTQYLEPEIGTIFNKYKKQWFGTDGRFKGIDAVKDSANQMAADINAAGNLFNKIYNGLAENLKQYFSATDDEAKREASQKGIATASQESVDELNGRATAIQGHTYNICEYTKELVTTSNLILQSVVNIEKETEGFGARIERMEGNLKGVKDTVEDIALKGIKIQS